MGVHAIPFHVLEKMGLLVADDGDGGSDNELGRRVVDENDRWLKVLAPDGAVVFNAETDNFESFYRQIRAAWKGQPVTRRWQPVDEYSRWFHTLNRSHSWIKFAGREVVESGRRVDVASAAIDGDSVLLEGSYWTARRFHHGQIVGRTATAHGETMRVDREDLRNLVTWGETPDIAGGTCYAVSDLTTGRTQTFLDRDEAATSEIFAFVGQYMDMALRAINAPAAECAALNSAWRSASPLASVKTYEKILQQLVDAGWLPTPYAGTNVREFFAEILVHAFTDPPQTTDAAPEWRPFELIAYRIRDALTMSGTPEAMAARIATIQTPDAQ